LAPYRCDDGAPSLVDLDAREIPPAKGPDRGGGDRQSMTAKGGGDLVVTDGSGSEKKQGFAERSQCASTVEAEVLTAGVFGEKAIELVGGLGHSSE